MGHPYSSNDSGESNCCGEGPIGEIIKGVARCSKCLEMAGFDPVRVDDEIEGLGLVTPVKSLIDVIASQSSAFKEVLTMFKEGIEVGGITINDGLQDRFFQHIKKQQENLENAVTLIDQLVIEINRRAK